MAEIKKEMSALFRKEKGEIDTLIFKRDEQNVKFMKDLKKQITIPSFIRPNTPDRNSQHSKSPSP